MFKTKSRSFPVMVVFVLSVSAAIGAEPAADRPESWAQPLVVEGVPNLHKVSDGLYRSAQPTAQGFRNLKEMGIKTVVNLRSFHSDRDEIGDLDLAYEHITMKAWHAEEKEAVRFLKIVADSNRGSVLVHCQHGADRTGTMCAVYRIAIQGWTKKDALREMADGGFGFHAIWHNLPSWIQKLNVEKLKRDAAVPAPRQEQPAA